MKKLSLCMCIAGFSIACGSSSPNTPTPVPVVTVPLCESRSTATLTIGNRSAGSTYTVSWDGSTRVTLGPGQTSPEYTEAAGVAHTLVYKYSNSSQLACTTSFPTMAACSSHTFTCSF
jgi:hypothetical protein